jgi:acetylornithine deacetylase/succinyl-diaminopimelate desuccinylase-like protein
LLYLSPPEISVKLLLMGGELKIMLKNIALFWMALLMALSSTMVAQQQGTTADPEIKKMLGDVSGSRLQADVEKLAAFHTRSTISSPDPSRSEIGAARVWIQAELERYSQACGGCLEVRLDRFIQEPAPRIPQPIEITNVYAVLRGSSPEDRDRVYVICGHYDSRAEDVLDTRSPAPGANDDGSGTAAVLEAARVLSQYRFPATLIFLALPEKNRG